MRQVRAGVSDRGAVPSGLDGGRDGEGQGDAAVPGHRPGEEAMARLRLATTGLGGCSGWHMWFLDIDEWLIDLAQMADIVYTPFQDIKKFPENVDVTLVEGAVANEDHLEQLELVRTRSRIVVSF